MNNNMTGTNTLNAIYENMGCKGEVVYNGGSLRPLSEDTLYLNRVHETTGGKSRAEIMRYSSHGSVNGLCVPDIYSGSILKPEHKNISTRDLWEQLNSLEIPKYDEDLDGYMDASRKEYEIRKKLVEATVSPEVQELHKKAGWGAGYLPSKKREQKPSTLEVVPYVADKHAHLPDYAREMIEMIEEAEYEALNNYLNSKEQWSRNVVIDEEGNEVVTWVHVSEQALDPELEEYKKFLASSSFEVENDKSVPVSWEGETVALQTLFNLHVGDVD